MYTEKDARTRWCHASNSRGIGSDGGLLLLPVSLCIASECMAWRIEFKPIPSKHQPPKEWCEKPTGRGYCGLAGKP